MDQKHVPSIFCRLQAVGCINQSDILKTPDGFWLIYKSLSDILAEKGIVEFPDSEGNLLECSKFFDDWFLYAIADGGDATYGLLKFREQEYDREDGSPADGDTPGVTISFISFACDVLLACIANPSDENRRKLDGEINRVVARRGQRHHEALKRYFIHAKSEGAYLAAATYIRHIASYAADGYLNVPEHYKEIVQQSRASKNAKGARLPRFMDALNQAAGHVVCDHEKIYLQNREAPTAFEAAAILATHTGNPSLYSFAAEVEYHARFLTPWTRIKLPFFGKSVYDSAVRADMSVADAEFQGTAPFYRETSRMVKRQHALHAEKEQNQFPKKEEK